MRVYVAWYSRHLAHRESTWSDALLADTAENNVTDSDQLIEMRAGNFPLIRTDRPDWSVRKWSIQI